MDIPELEPSCVARTYMYIKPDGRRYIHVYYVVYGVQITSYLIIILVVQNAKSK